MVVAAKSVFPPILATAPNDPVPDLRHIRPEVPLDLVEIVEKSLRKRREERFNSAAEMAVALKKVLDRLTRSQSLRSTRMEYPIDKGGNAVVSESFPIIILEVGSTPGQEIELRKSEYLIGRESGLDLTISSPAVSSRHAPLLRKGNQVQLEDLGSSNGTFVNGIRLAAVKNLKPGDEITLGQTIRLRSLGLPGELKTQLLEASLKDKTELEGATRLESPPPLQEPAPEPKLTRRFPPSVDQAPPPVEVRHEPGSLLRDL